MEYTIDKSEVLRYLGAKQNLISQKMLDLIDIYCDELLRVARPKYVYKIFPLSLSANLFCIGNTGIKLGGETATDYFSGCTHCAILSATLGLEADTLIRQAQATDMTKAVIYDACATELVEKVCDRAQNEILEIAASDALAVTNRFSPGYGDLPIELQPNICSVLDTVRQLGVNSSSDYLLIPTKSVTAFAGLGKSDKIRGKLFNKCKNHCIECNMRNSCPYGKNGDSNE